MSEVASAGGFVKEYQVELNPDAMRAFNVSVMDIMGAIKKSTLDIGAETMEINKVEYLIRGLGYIKDVSDLEKAVVTVRDGVPVRISDVAFVNIGPGTRRGGLDKEGVEAVGGVVIARYGSNPLEVINNVKDKIKEMAPGLPQKTLPDGTVSKITVVPFYDRTGLIKETIGTLETSLSHEILICIIVIIVLVLNLRASVVIASMLPIAVLSTFIIMRYTGIAANIVALSGIAIAIGVMVDVGVVFVESIIRYMEMPENRGVRKGKAMVNLIYKAVSEVSGAIATAMITTIVSFLPVFAMEAQEGKMFSPLAYTKTYALASAFVLGLILLPTLSYILFSVRIDSKRIRKVLNYILIAAGVLLSVLYSNIPALGLTAVGLNNLLAHRWKKPGISNYINIGIALVVATYFLAEEWLPMGPQKGIIVNLLFVTGCIAIILALLWLLVIYYERILRWCLNTDRDYPMRHPDLETDRARVHAQPQRRFIPVDADQHAPYWNRAKPELYRSTGQTPGSHPRSGNGNRQMGTGKLGTRSGSRPDVREYDQLSSRIYPERRRKAGTFQSEPERKISSEKRRHLQSGRRLPPDSGR